LTATKRTKNDRIVDSVIGAAVLVAMIVLTAGCTAPETNVPLGHPASHLETQGSPMVRQVEVTILGHIGDAKGLDWPRDASPDRTLSIGVDEPCDLTVHLPSGKILALRTRPVLVVSHASGSDIVTEVLAPPEERKGSLADKAREIDKFLMQWHVVPDRKMRETLDEWKRSDDSGSDDFHIAASLRIRTELDARTQLSFAVSSLTPGWNLVVEIEAKPEEWENARHQSRSANSQKGS
jgi:hypothetical protein